MLEITWLMIKRGMKKKIQGSITKKGYVKNSCHVCVMFKLII